MRGRYSLILSFALMGCATAHSLRLVPSEEVARHGQETSIWTEASASDPNRIEIIRPVRFSAVAANAADLSRAFGWLSATFPTCPVPSELGYATWSHEDDLVILFEVRTARGCPTNPMVSIDSNGDVTVISSPDQPSMFE
jgi:hypothetical protein